MYSLIHLSSPQSLFSNNPTLRGIPLIPLPNNDNSCFTYLFFLLEYTISGARPQKHMQGSM